MKGSQILLAGEPMCLFRSMQEGVPLAAVQQFHTGVAGAELNVAIGLTRLGHTATYLSKVGRDPFGRGILDAIARMGISTDCITFSDTHRTGLVFKEQNAAADPEIFYIRAGSAASTISPADIDAIDLTGFQAVHLTGILPALSDSCRAAAFRLKERAQQAGLLVSFDPNLRPQLWGDLDRMRAFMHQFAEGCDLFFPGIAEAELLTGLTDPQEMLRFYHALGTKTVLLKNGGKGAFYKRGAEEGAIKGFSVPVADTVGAGDGFAAGVLSALLEGLSLPEAIRRGNALGARQVTVLGDNEGLPTREELEEFYRQHSC